MNKKAMNLQTLLDLMKASDHESYETRDQAVERLFEGVTRHIFKVVCDNETHDASELMSAIYGIKVEYAKIIVDCETGRFVPVMATNPDYIVKAGIGGQEFWDAWMLGTVNLDDERKSKDILSKFSNKKRMLFFRPLVVKYGLDKMATKVLDTRTTYLPTHVLENNHDVPINTRRFIEDVVKMGSGKDEYETLMARMKIFDAVVKLIALGNEPALFVAHRTVVGFGKPIRNAWLRVVKDRYIILLPAGGEKIKDPRELVERVSENVQEFLGKRGLLTNFRYEYVMFLNVDSYFSWSVAQLFIRMAKEFAQTFRAPSLNNVSSLGLRNAKVAIIDGNILGIDLQSERTVILIGEGTFTAPTTIKFVKEYTLRGETMPPIELILNANRETVGYKVRLPRVDVHAIEDSDDIYDDDEDGWNVYMVPDWFKIKTVKPYMKQTSMMPAKQVIINEKGEVVDTKTDLVKPTTTFVVEVTIDIDYPSKMATGKAVVIDKRHSMDSDVVALRNQGVELIMSPQHVTKGIVPIQRSERKLVSLPSGKNAAILDVTLGAVIEPNPTRRGTIADGLSTRLWMPDAAKAMLDQSAIEVHSMCKSCGACRGVVAKRAAALIHLEVALGNKEFPIKKLTHIAKSLESRNPELAKTIAEYTIDGDPFIYADGKVVGYSEELTMAYVSGAKSWIRHCHQKDENPKKEETDEHYQTMRRVYKTVVGLKGVGMRLLGFLDQQYYHDEMVKMLNDNKEVKAMADKVIVYFITGNIREFSKQKYTVIAMKKSPRFQGYIMLTIYKHDPTITLGGILSMGAMDINGHHYKHVADASDNDGDSVAGVKCSIEFIKEHINAFAQPLAKPIDLSKNSAPSIDEITDALKKGYLHFMTPIDDRQESIIDDLVFAGDLLFFAGGGSKEGMGVELAGATYKVLIDKGFEQRMAAAFVQDVANVGFCKAMKKPQTMHVLEELLVKFSGMNPKEKAKMATIIANNINLDTGIVDWLAISKEVE